MSTEFEYTSALLHHKKQHIA
uniref:Uncharacterized protein n=1 Tax=Anguilla anguilla TaxID=7936 RepID=A0A0E9UNB2_ANGAN